MSRNDRYVAFTLQDQVRVYEICTRTIQRVSLGSGMDRSSDFGHRSVMGASPNAKGTAYQGKRQEAIIERKLQFSPDGKHFAIATHLGDHYAYVDVWNCTFQQWSIVPDKSKSFKLPSVCISVLPSTRIVQLTFSSSGPATTGTLRGYSMMGHSMRFSLRPSLRKNTPRFSRCWTTRQQMIPLVREWCTRRSHPPGRDSL